MGLKTGIVGLPNVGKSTLFNAITKLHILAANYPFATIDPNVGVVTVPDKRLSFMEELYKPERVIGATYEFTDIAGLVKGASKGEGLGNKFLSHIREVDAICEVVRCFDDTNIIHIENGIDPVRDVEIINAELVLADIDVIETRINKIGKKASLSNDKETVKEANLLNKIKDGLYNNIPVRKMELSEDEYKILKPFSLLTSKPIIYMANVSEDELLTENNYVKRLKEYAYSESSEVIVLCAKLESELVELSEEDALDLLHEMGINESGLDKLIKATYSLLGLATYFTAGSDEVRAWTFKKGMKAPECAGIIHSDFERGFIKAEIMSYDDLSKYGNERSVKENGRMRLEGKEYLMQDGDICYFRFNT